MLFNFGKNASSNVMKTATHLKDVIEKTVENNFQLKLYNYFNLGLEV